MGKDKDFSMFMKSAHVLYRAAHRKPVADRNRSLGCLMIMITVPK